MNVVIPMAGRGSRFEQAGYTFPKPLIAVNGKPMIQVVIENLNLDAHYIFMVQKEHEKRFHLTDMLSIMVPGCDVVTIHGVTDGAACTILTASSLIDNDDPIFIANSDQVIEWHPQVVMQAFRDTGMHGGAITVDSLNPAYSYVRVDNQGHADLVAEKHVISRHATTGHYYWRHGSEFVRYARRMIAKNLRVNNEFYVCPVYNEAIADGHYIGIQPVQKMWSLGTPEDLTYYLREHHT